jgi:hypothetical protein
MSLPTRDELAAGLDRKTPAVTERGRSMVTAHTKNRLMHGKAADGSNAADQTRVIYVRPGAWPTRLTGARFNKRPR